eukprot:TCONS_00027980-protein
MLLELFKISLLIAMVKTQGNSNLDSLVTIGSLKRTSPKQISCKYTNRNGGTSISRTTFCPEDSSCVALRLYKHQPSTGWVEEREYKGCLPTFSQNKKLYKDMVCPKKPDLTGFCYLQKLTAYVQKDSNRQYLYCCCRGNNCNKLLVTNPQTQWPETTLEPKSKQEKTKNSTMFLTAIISSVTFFLIVFCFAVVYTTHKISKRRRQPNRDNQSLMMRTELLLPSPKTMSDEALDNIMRGNLIHQGTISAVRLATLDGKEVSVKIYQPRSKNQWTNEKEIYELLGEHPNVAKFITSERIPQDFGFEGIIVMEYYTQGSLLNYLRNNTLSWVQMIRLACCISKGLSFLHRETNKDGSSKVSIAHRDLTSRNVLMKKDGTCVLADFGYALRLKGKYLNGKFPLVGSPRYMAPEMLDGSIMQRDWVTAFKQADCYGLALLLWELSRRCRDIIDIDGEVPECLLPFEEELGSGPSVNKVHGYVCVKQYRPQFPSQWIQNNMALELLKQTITECWDQEADARLTPSCVLNRLKQMIDSEQNSYHDSSNSSRECLMLISQNTDLVVPSSRSDVYDPKLVTTVKS